jgi:hypothetical protein
MSTLRKLAEPALRTSRPAEISIVPHIDHAVACHCSCYLSANRASSKRFSASGTLKSSDRFILAKKTTARRSNRS